MKESYSPFLGSRTSPPLYFDLLFPAVAPPSSLLRFSGTRYLSWWNSCRSKYSVRSARLLFMVVFHRLPAMLVSCFVRGNACILNMRRCNSSASRSVWLARLTRCWPVLQYAGTSSGSISLRSSTPSWVLDRLASEYVVSRPRNSFALSQVSHMTRPSRALSMAQELPLPNWDEEGRRIWRRRPILDHMLTLSSTQRFSKTSIS
mmetsp:Transcript_7991/g.17288  ORF Transcript_7991/g.17288 Transcript_7991/m.17288 type:complete len:204 (+) Transcript_7991:2-613(+)